jgi:hypothetical protein
LGWLEMGEAKGWQVLVFVSKLGQLFDDRNQLGPDQFQGLGHDDQSVLSPT